MLFSILRSEVKRVMNRWQTLLAFVLFIAFFIQGFFAFRPAPVAHLSNDYINYYLAFLYAQGKGPGALFCGIFPLVIALVAGDSLAWDRKSGFDQLILLRTTSKRYILGKTLSASIISFFFVFLSELVAFVIAMCMFPGINAINQIKGITPTYAINLYVSHPFAYILLIILNTALLGMAISLFSVFISTAVKNIYVVIATPWLLFFILQFVFGILGFYRYAPLDLEGLYMSNSFSYNAYEIPAIWIVLWFLLLLISYASFTNKYKARF